MKPFVLFLATATTVVLASCLGTAPAHAAKATIWNTYGELVDHGEIRATLAMNDGHEADCRQSIRVDRQGNSVALTALPGSGGPPILGCGTPTAILGTLPAGHYDVSIRLYTLDGTSFEDGSQAFDVLPLAGRCNRFPEIERLPSGIAFEHNTLAPDAVAARVASDPSFAALLDYPQVRFHVDPRHPELDSGTFYYPPLDNLPEKIDLLASTQQFKALNPLLPDFCLGVPAGETTGEVIEFYNAQRDHYFYSASDDEIHALDAGIIVGWTRTQESFRVVSDSPCPWLYGRDTVYRFFGTPGVGPDTHFFTRDRNECDVVRKTNLWTYEGAAFWASPLTSQGGCASAAETPLYRVWRPFGESNHRFTTKRAVVDEMVGKGWVEEGPVMCVRADLE